MKILVVTSEVTFVPDNYNQFLEGLLTELKDEKELAIELVILKNNSPLLPLKGLVLMLAGARHIGFHLIKNSFKALFKDRQHLPIPIHFFKSPNSPEFLLFVKNHQTDLLINARTRFIYKSKILQAPKLGAINIHHGLLPGYRGTMCDLWALFDDRPTGFSIHMMEKKIDNGAIIRRVRTTLPHETTVRSNFATLILKSSKLEGVEMALLLKSIKKNKVIPIEQANFTANPIYTKNPDFPTIRKMLHKGIEL